MYASRILFWLALGTTVCCVLAVEYRVIWTPHRVAYNSNVTVTFQLHNYTTLTSVSLRFFYEFFIAENRQCRSVLTSGAEVDVLTCDFDNAVFVVQLRKYTETKTFTIHAYGQEPTYHKFIIPMYKAPTGLKLSVPKSLRSGMSALLRCEFDLGQNNLANFSWFRRNSSRLIPSGRYGELLIPDKKDQKDLYGHMSHFEFAAQPGDEGFYQCSAIYNPQTVGPFSSDVVYLDVKYAPQIDMNKDYFSDHDVRVGEKVILTWSILSNPEPSHVFWTRNGVIVKNNAKYRILKRETDFGFKLSLQFKANWENFGTFFCFVNNTIGSTQIYFHVRDINFKTTKSNPKDKNYPVQTKEVVKSPECAELEFERGLWRIVALSLMCFILCAILYLAIYSAVSSRKRKKRLNGDPEPIKMQRVI